MTNVSPKPSTATPARTNTAREGGEASSTIAASTSNHPVTNNKKPTNFMPNAPGPELTSALWRFAMPVKISHPPEVRAALGAFDNYGSSPLFFELANRIMQYRLAVTEACHLKIASGQLLQTPFAFFEVFVP